MWIDKELNAQIEEATRTYYTRDYYDNTRKEVYIPKENLYMVIEDLLAIIEQKNKEIEDITKDRDENYKQIDVASQY